MLECISTSFHDINLGASWEATQALLFAISITFVGYCLGWSWCFGRNANGRGDGTLSGSPNCPYHHPNASPYEGISKPKVPAQCVIDMDYPLSQRQAKPQGPLPRKKAKEVVIAAEVETPQTTRCKPPQVSDVPEDPSSQYPMVSADSEIPPATVIRDSTVADEDGESNTLEVDEKDLLDQEIYVYEDLEDLEGDISWVATEASLCDTSMIGSSGSKPTDEVVTQPSGVGVEQGTDSQVEVTPASKRSPQA
uniref:Uncharacterized protein n=1 Tax=Solanum tuberosum TaxID=4113 RepID=M1E1A6_SOLTU